MMLEEFIQNKAFDTGDDLVTMYSAFLKNFQTKLSQLRLMKILVRVSKQYSGATCSYFSCRFYCISPLVADANEAMAFLQGIREDVAKEPEAQVMCDMGEWPPRPHAPACIRSTPCSCCSRATMAVDVLFVQRSHG